MTARAELAEPRELRRGPLPEAGALPCVRLLVTRREEARQRRVGRAGEQTAVPEERLCLVNRLERTIRCQPALVRPAFLEFRECCHGSSTIVTGPSLTSSSSIFAPKTPVSTGTPSARSSAQKRSYTGSASSGGAASPKLGLLPFAVSAMSVNCDTTSAAPSTSSRERSNLPS